MNYFILCFKKYAQFKGRASRAEFWYFNLFNLIILLILGFSKSLIAYNFSISLELIYTLAVAIPAITVTARRLHDTGRSGWMMFIDLIPLVGPIWLLILLASDSTPGSNKYGPNPKGVK